MLAVELLFKAPWYVIELHPDICIVQYALSSAVRRISISKPSVQNRFENSF